MNSIFVADAIGFIGQHGELLSHRQSSRVVTPVCVSFFASACGTTAQRLPRAKRSDCQDLTEPSCEF